MKALVGVKRCLDYAIKVRVNPSQTGVELGKLKMSMNPFDEIAVEEALRMREAGKVKEVIALTIGPKKAVDVLRNALAMGADSAIHVMTDMTPDQDLQPLAVAKVYKHIMERDQFDLALMGKQSIDDDYVQTGQILSSIMDVPSATFCSEIQFSDDAA